MNDPIGPSDDDDAIEWPVRIGWYLTPSRFVLVPPRIAAWLEDKANLSSDKRILLRGSDPEAYAVLAALHLVALYHRSGSGTESAMGLRNSPESETWLTTAETATQLGVTKRCIRKRIAAGRLSAVKRGGRWLIDRNEIQITQALGLATKEPRNGHRQL